MARLRPIIGLNLRFPNLPPPPTFLAEPEPRRPVLCLRSSTDSAGLPFEAVCVATFDGTGALASLRLADDGDLFMVPRLDPFRPIGT